MNNKERALMNLCLKDQLFCSMFGGLDYMHKKYALPSPCEIWLKSLYLTQEIHSSPRPDLAAELMLEEANVCVLASLLYIEMTQDMENAQVATELKDVLCNKLNASEHWPELYHEIRKSEQGEEDHGRYVIKTDYVSKEFPSFSLSSNDTIQVNEIVTTTIKTGDPNLERVVAYLLRRIDDNHDGAFREDIHRLEQHADDSSTRTTEQLNKIIQQQGESYEVMEKAASRPVIGQLVLEQKNIGIESEKVLPELENKMNINKQTYNG